MKNKLWNGCRHSRWAHFQGDLVQEAMWQDPLGWSVPEISNYRSDLEQGGSGDKCPDTLRKKPQALCGRETEAAATC